MELAEARVHGVSYAFGVDQEGTLRVSGSEVLEVLLGLLIAGTEATQASMWISQCRMEGVLWFGAARPGNCTLEQNVLAQGCEGIPPAVVAREVDSGAGGWRGLAGQESGGTPWVVF